MAEELTKEMLYVPFGEIIRSIATGIAEAQFELDKSSMTVAELMGGQRILRDASTGEAILKSDGSHTVIDSRVFFGHTYQPLGSGAVATAQVGNLPGAVTSLQIENGGSGFPETTGGTSLPLIFTGDGENASGEVTVNKAGVITEVRLLEGGTGFSTPPVVTVDNADGTGAVIVAEIEVTENVLLSIDIDPENRGEGYFLVPQVRIISEEGEDAEANATINDKGEIIGFTITNHGQGYTTSPVIEIVPANATIPQKLSMMELGFIPNFYQFVDTVIEIKLALRINKIAGKKGSNSHRVFGATVDANYASSYNYNINLAASVKTKIVPIPPPTVLEDRIARMMESNDLLDENQD